MKKAIALLFMTSLAAVAQSSNGYLFFGGGGILSTDPKSGGLVHIGAGGDVLAAKGLGVNAEIGGLYGWVYGAGGYFSFAPGLSFHFSHGKKGKVDPFLTGGYTLLSTSKAHGNLVHLGVGLTVWGRGRAGFRVEFRDQIGSTSDFLHTAPTGAIHFLEFRVALALRPRGAG